MAKKKHGVRMTEDTARLLRIQAAHSGLPVGDVVEALLIMARDGRLTDEELGRALSENFMRGHSLPMGGPR